MPQPASLSYLGGADREARLARAAATGTGRAFASLYERHEERVFNLALRITGSCERAVPATREAFLDALRAVRHLEQGESFGSCLLTAVRNASHYPPPEGGGVPAGDARGEPPTDPPADPAFEAWQEQLRQAGLRLSAHEREALALAAMPELSYADIGAIMDVDAGTVPLLVARSRLALHDELSGTSVASMAASSEQCEQALPLIAMRDDGRLEDEADFQSLVDHLAHCGDCRLRLDAVEEASAAYRAWQRVTPPAVLLREVMSAAARLAGADWDELIDDREARRAAGRRGARQDAATAPTNPLPAFAPALGDAGAAAAGALGSMRAAASGVAVDTWRRRPQRDSLVSAGLLAVVLLGLSAIAVGATLVLGREQKPAAVVPQAAEPRSVTRQGPTFPTRHEARPSGRTADTRDREARRRGRTRPQPAPATEPRRTEAGKPAPRRKRRTVPKVVAVPVPTTTPAPPPAETAPELPTLQRTNCKDAGGTPVPCPG